MVSYEPTCASAENARALDATSLVYSEQPLAVPFTVSTDEPATLQLAVQATSAEPVRARAPKSGILPRQLSMLINGIDSSEPDEESFGPSLATLIASAMEEWADAPELGTEDLLSLERALAHNLRTGRALRFIQNQQLSAVELPVALAARVDPLAEPGRAEQMAHLVAYVRAMAAVYWSERDRLAALAASEPDDWNALCEQLTRQAYHQLVSRSIGPWYAHDKATELAQQACVRIFSAVYPCDVSFDSWVGAILRNAVIEFTTRSRDLLDRSVTLQSIDQLDEQGIEPQAPEPPRSAPPPEMDPGAVSLAFGDNEELLEAIRSIRSDERRAVLIMTYFQELDDGEIAARIGKSRGAVHTLRCRALTQLRGALAQLRDADNCE